MKYISQFKNFINEIGAKTLSEIVNDIRGDYFKEPVLKIQRLVKSGEKEKADKLKKGLIAFTVSGKFEGGRKLSFLKTYNPFVIFLELFEISFFLKIYFRKSSKFNYKHFNFLKDHSENIFF